MLHVYNSLTRTRAEVKTGETQKPRADVILNVLTKSNSDVKSLWTRECVAKKDPKEVTDDDYDEYVYGSIALCVATKIE